MLDSALFFMWPEIFGNYTFMGEDAPEPVPEGECCTVLLAAFFLAAECENIAHRSVLLLGAGCTPGPFVRLSYTVS